MTEAGRRHTSGWKILGLVAGVAAAFLIAAAVWMKLAVNRGRAEWGAELKASIAAERARSGARPVLWGEARPGNAWDDYDRALAGCPKLPAGKSLGEILDPKHDDKPDGPLAQLPQYASWISQLRAGARRASARKDYEWEKGALTSPPPFVPAGLLGRLALLEARVRVKKGDPSEAVREILDVLQFGRDFASDGPLLSHALGSSLMGAALQEARDWSAGGSTDAASRELLERGLQALLGKFPGMEDALLRECLYMDSTLQEVASQNDVAGFLYLNSARRQREWIRRAAAASRVSWAEGLKVDGEIRAEIDRAWNPLVKSGAATFGPPAGMSSRLPRVQAVLLLVGVHFQRTGEVLAVDDPFGTKLLSSKNGDSLKVWSVGPDGVDNGGAGGWKMHDGPDVVLDVKR